ncbi:MAG: rhodanese-like domain-containing protein [Opitutales bacterium]|jgi:rhodanese-related sulfurtransferase
MKKILTMLVAGLFAATVYAGEYPDVSIKDLQSAIKDGKVTVIDVNGAGSFKKGHIPTAIHFASAQKDLAKLLPKDKKTLIVAYCGGPGCSAYKRGASAAKKLGYTNVKHLSAGISGWKKAGADLAKAKK